MLQKSLFAALLLGTTLTAGSAMAQDATSELRIEGTVENACLVDANDVTGLIFNGVSVSGETTTSVQVLCNAGTAYSLTPGDGLNFGASAMPNRRALSDGEGNFIPYDLYQGSGFTNWGQDGLAITGVGTGQREGHPITIRFFQLSRAPGGIYSDTVVQTVTYN